MKRGKCNDTLLRNVGQVYMSHLRPVECDSGGVRCLLGCMGLLSASEGFKLR